MKRSSKNYPGCVRAWTRTLTLFSFFLSFFFFFFFFFSSFLMRPGTKGREATPVETFHNLTESSWPTLRNSWLLKLSAFLTNELKCELEDTYVFFAQSCDQRKIFTFHSDLACAFVSMCVSHLWIPEDYETFGPWNVKGPVIILYITILENAERSF